MLDISTMLSFRSVATGGRVAGPDFPSLLIRFSNIQMQPCWAVMVSFESPLATDWVGAFIHESILTWAARNSTKPGRPADAEHIWCYMPVMSGPPKTGNANRTVVAEEMLAAFWQATGIKPQPTQLQAHRWKFAIPVDPPGQRCFFDAETGLSPVVTGRADRASKVRSSAAWRPPVEFWGRFHRFAAPELANS